MKMVKSTKIINRLKMNKVVLTDILKSFVVFLSLFTEDENKDTRELVELTHVERQTEEI